MPNFTAADTIRILVATDNHVGYNERDSIRGDDSWKSFHEVMCLAKQRDVDMVLLAGDLFHENKPSRKSMYNVMRSLRLNCYGEKPCELEMLSDGSEIFADAFNHVNYEDPDINVAIPVFSIHGNHDDPSGEGHLAALDLLQMAGLINYYGRTPEADKIEIKPVLLQKGNTKLALYGMSNVRDERLFRTFRDGFVKFFQPGTQKDDWFNLMSVHQNHHAYTSTGYLPENFLPSFMNLVVWGHEHKCEIEPTINPETGFKVMQPGSSVATSLVPGEAVAKHVAIVTIKGKEFDVEPIRLKTVRPFIMREIALSDNREMSELALDTGDVKPRIMRYLMSIIEEMIKEGADQWREQRREAGEEDDDDTEVPLPLIRLRVEYTPPEGGRYEVENPQRFSNRYVERVANVNDIIQFHRKRAVATRTAKGKADMPEESVMQQLTLDNAKVEKLVQEFLTAQSLTILPQNSFSDALNLYVDKDDNKVVQDFIGRSLNDQLMQLLAGSEDDEIDEERIADMMEEIKAKLESTFASSEKKRKAKKARPRPEHWDSDQEGQSWEDSMGAFLHDSDDQQNGTVVNGDEEDEEDESAAPKKTAGRARGRGRGGKAAAGTTRKTAAASKKAPAKAAASKGRKKQIFEDDDEDEDEEMIIIDDDEEDEDEALFVKPAKKAPAKKAPAKAAATKPSARGGQQSQLSFTQTNGTSSRTSAKPRAAAAKAPARRVQEPSDDEISDDDAFEPAPAAARTRR